MHILIIPSWYPDERKSNDVSGIFFKELAEAYAQQGHLVSVLAHLLPFPLNPRKLKRFISRKSFQSINSVKTYNVKFLNWSGYRHIDESSTIRAAVYWFRRYIKHNGYPEIIHAHSTFNAGIIALKIKEKYNVAYHLTEHGSWFLKEISNNDAIKAIDVFQNAEKYTAVGSVLLNKLIENFSLNAINGKVIPNILPHRFLTKKTTSLYVDKFIFLNIALDGSNKRRDLLIKSFNEAFIHNSNIELWIGGTVFENETIMNQAKELNIENKIKILGLLDRDQVHQAMADCNVFVLTSDIETFGIVLIEALSQGKPIISTDCGGPRDIVTNKNGLLVPTNNVNALAIAMKKMKDEYTNYEPETIRQECIEKYSPDVVIKQYLNQYS
jgi:L-malate glycosyltransferase